jgi:hypothetical protein
VKKYFFTRFGQFSTIIEADRIFWSGMAVVFVKGQDTVFVAAIQPGDIIAEEGSYKDPTPEQKKEAQAALELAGFEPDPKAPKQ